MTSFDEQLDSTEEGVPTGASYIPTPFEEQYPSLKHKVDAGCSNCGAFGPCISIDDVQEHCRDKQRVKEVVTAYLDNHICKKDERIRKYRDGILKELNL